MTPDRPSALTRLKPKHAAVLVQALLFITGILLTVGLTRIFLVTNGLNEPLLPTFLPAALTLALLGLLFAAPRRALITVCTLLLLAMLALLLAPDRIMPIRDRLAFIGADATSAFYYFTGQGSMSPSLVTFTVTAVTVVTALMVHLLTVWAYAPLLLAAGLLGLMSLDAFLGVPQDIPGVALAGAGILVLLVRRMPQTGARRKAPRRRHSLASLLAAIPVIAVALAVALALSPLLPARIGNQQQLIEGLVDDITQMMGIPPVQELQPDFSISFAGYYPLDTRLGGPVSLATGPVMDVSGHSATLLLRGAMYESYDGNSWQRDPRVETFRFDNAFQNELRTQVFDLDQPDANLVSRGVVNSLIEETRLRIMPLATATSMIFTPGRPVSITPKTNERFQVHYDEYGMLYSKYPLTTANPYEIVSRVPSTGGQLFQTSVGLALQVGVSSRAPREPLNPDTYLRVPSFGPYTANGSLRQLAQEITAGIENPYDKALAIRAYLIRNNTYNLNVPVPPENREFVSWFLETGEGYCVYFATAQAMLSRLAGVPARYAEGFILNPPATANGTTTVSADLAHAWAEVYLPYIGWVPVDATPGATIPTSEDPVEPTGAEPTPLPGEVTEEPIEEISPTPEPDELTPEDIERRERGMVIFLMLPLLLLAVAVGIESQRRGHLLRFPLRLREDYPDPRQRAEIYWQEIQLLLSEEKLRLSNGETPISFLKRAGRRHSGGDSRLAEAGRLISRIRYGRYLPRETDLAFLASVMSALDENAWTLRRVRHFLLYTLMPRLHAVDGRPRLIRSHFLKPLANRLRRKPRS